ncbi:VanZ family protein [Mucilaginibacter sp. ZT4R22]|uniref:VanZ family protein n=1 Tax=Mucilaginibacter pankratovii TaxID=2772110 RepID=A0ABR7WYI4_9SPHI|nr:VanZ family protein [Mucilaginibacter pankratovii]MBD1367346.1 VanZ family protein [Mucilaginibacter pankratovii]
MLTRIKPYWPAILWAIFVLVICSVPMGGIGSSHLFFPGFDKLTHCGLFFVLAVLYCYGSIRKFKTREVRIEIAMKNTIVLISYGALIEMLQMYVFTWRSGEAADLFADTVGACMGIFGVLVTSNALNHESI